LVEKENIIMKVVNSWLVDYTKDSLLASFVAYLHIIAWNFNSETFYTVFYPYRGIYIIFVGK